MNIISFVSLGPGSPELITLKGLRALHNADIILTPSTVNKDNKIRSRSKDILSALEIDEKKIKLFDVPMSKDRADTLKSYCTVAVQASEYYSEGLKVAIVAEGDAGFYSSSQYINDELIKMSIPTQRIEGIPAFIACGALANIHIVKQEEQLIVIPGKIEQESFMSYFNSHKSIVIMKPSQSEEIIKEIIHSETNIIHHYFENVGIPDKEFYTSDRKKILDRKFPYFSLLIIQNKS